jgi:hypothetical protein
MMKHEQIRWNPINREWYCAKCGQTSDHISEQDAHSELQQYDCQLPAADPLFPREE